MTTALAIKTSSIAEPDGFEMKPRTLEEAMKFCDIMANSDLVPNGYKGKPGNIMVAIQMGNELGMTPMRALRSIAVINGRASIWGDDMLAMVLASPVCEYVDESGSTEKAGICKTKRKGCAEQVSTFTLDDARRAGLLGKQGPWQTNTARMLKLRARGFGLRDTFADVLAGLVSAEEALDLPRVEAEAGPTTILEAAQPLTLKDKLKAKVEAIEEAPAPASGVKELTAAIHEPAPAPSVFEQSSAVADYELAMAEAESPSDLQAVWDAIVPDKRLSTADRTALYQQYQRAGKLLAKAKGPR